jgi:hypothetical protein
METQVTYTDPGDQPHNKTWKRKRTVTLENGMKINLFDDPPPMPEEVLAEAKFWQEYDAPAPSVPRPTSEFAADSQGKTKRAIDRITILRTLAWQSEGLTRDQIAEETGISPNTVRPRIVELVTLGLVSDERITRLTVTGSPAAVCEVTEKGRMALKAMP